MKPLSSPSSAPSADVSTPWLDLLGGVEDQGGADLGSRIRRLAELAAAVHSEVASQHDSIEDDFASRLASGNHQAASLMRAVIDREAA